MRLDGFIVNQHMKAIMYIAQREAEADFEKFLIGDTILKTSIYIYIPVCVFLCCRCVKSLEVLCQREPTQELKNFKVVLLS